ncbi:CocE/NonD family hydrolase [Sphingomonas sp. BAUL-RG-20F-R05-02]|uniref:CocE/NonD family hydrolase n=1 Tax=Sphingomonas sp. BAUL-RG-20F-R05-02 TaxID=2914830 RepID=UPI001F596EB4|nr:CocE/NonD family hydrolase [Sphingomonas sp. BAUL-RG-20F-R05-02]
MTRLNRRCGATTAITLMSLMCSTAGVAQQPGGGDPLVARRSFYLPMRDGVRLAVNVYRPAKAGVADTAKAPVVFAFTPYRARYYDKGKLVELLDSREFGLRNLVHAGYVVATADIRGKGASFGARRGFLDQTEAKDGAEIVQWLARQPYSSGDVGLIGCSYLGGTAMLVAGAAPPAVKAVFAAATDWDKYEFVSRGGITGQFNTRPEESTAIDLASAPVDGDTGGVLLKQAVAQHAGNTPMAPLWYGIPYRDSMSALTGTRFWEEVGPYTHKAALTRPGMAWYLWGNWNDEPTEQIIRAAANLPAKMIIGPGSHCEPPKQFDINTIQKRFFDRYLKGERNGIDTEPKYAWWRQDGSGGELIRSNTLPGVGVKRTSLFLQPDGGVRSGMLADKPGGSRTLDYPIDYNISTDAYFPFWPETPDARAAVFTSPALAEPATVEGYSVVSIRAAADGRQANIFAYLEDVDPSGKSVVLAQGRLAASHRKLSKPPYDDLDLPYHSGLTRDAEPLVPGQPATLVFDLSPRSYVVPAHHRLRVALAGADPRQRNLAAIKDGLAKRWTIYGAASRIDIPFKTPVRFEAGTEKSMGEAK